MFLFPSLVPKLFSWLHLNPSHPVIDGVTGCHYEKRIPKPREFPVKPTFSMSF